MTVPIRPENVGRYPRDWPAIARAVKDAAGWRCQCRGECGRARTHLAFDGRCRAHHGDMLESNPSRTVVLTTAHLNHTPEDVRDENLRAFCQGCHLWYDRDHHAETRAATRAAAEHDADQAALW